MEILIRLLVITLIGIQCSYSQKQAYTIVDTGVSEFYSDSTIIEEPKPNEHF